MFLFRNHRKRISMINDEDFLQQPLTNEDGSLNPACLNELESAIKNIPPVHERFLGDIEYTTPRITYKKAILGAFACWAVRQSPYDCPENLETVIRYLGACLQKSVCWDDDGYAKLSLANIAKLLHDILLVDIIPEFESWNMPKIADSSHTLYVDMNSKVDSDRDFIDLNALVNNVCISIRDERREDDRFNAKFEKDWEEKHGVKPFL